jgi:hypothetical protein
VLGRVVEEAEEFLGVVGDLGHRLGPLDAVVGREGLDGALGVVAVGASRTSAKALRAPACTALGRQHSTLASL